MEKSLKEQLKNSEEKLLEYADVLKIKNNNPLQDEQRSNNGTARGEILLTRSHSPANSADVNSLAEELSNDIIKVVDWQQVQTFLIYLSTFFQIILREMLFAIIRIILI